MNLSEVKAAATAKMNGPIGLEQQNTLAYFALAALPVIEAARWYATEYEVADESGELMHWPDGEATRCKAIYDAIALLDECVAKMKAAA